MTPRYRSSWPGCNPYRCSRVPSTRALTSQSIRATWSHTTLITSLAGTSCCVLHTILVTNNWLLCTETMFCTSRLVHKACCDTTDLLVPHTDASIRPIQTHTGIRPGICSPWEPRLVQPVRPHFSRAYPCPQTLVELRTRLMPWDRRLRVSSCGMLPSYPRYHFVAEAYTGIMTT